MFICVWALSCLVSWPLVVSVIGRATYIVRTLWTGCAAGELRRCIQLQQKAITIYTYICTYIKNGDTLCAYHCCGMRVCASAKILILMGKLKLMCAYMANENGEM